LRYTFGSRAYGLQKFKVNRASRIGFGALFCSIDGNRLPLGLHEKLPIGEDKWKALIFFEGKCGHVLEPAF
jgi:hypothetical protein